MAQFVITKTAGAVFRLNADGEKIRLKVGDIVESGDQIITDAGASVRFEDAGGQPLELGENASTVLPQSLSPAFVTPPEAPVGSQADGLQAPIPDDEHRASPSDSAGDSDSEMHTFTELPRIEYSHGINLSYARDVNVTEEIAGRASLNPRIKYGYNVEIAQEIQSYHDPRFPFDGWRDRGGRPFEPERPAEQETPAPEPADTSAVTDEDTPITVDPLENFSIPAGVALSVAGAEAQYGAVQIIDGKISYTPNADYHGGDKITVTITDQSGRTYESEIKVTVNPVADTVNDGGSVTENSHVNIDVMANDKFADLPGAKVVEVTQGEKGTVSINPDGTIKYTPTIDYLAEGETTTDTCTYKVETAAGNYEEATVTITITGTNDAPVVTAVTGAATEDTALTASGNVITEHTTDLDASDTHTISAVNGEPDKVGQTINGTYGDIKVNADGSYEYTLRNDDANVQALAAGESHDEVFSVTVSDGHGGETTQDITVTVHGTNDAPTAQDNASSVVEDTRISTGDTDTAHADGSILANDADVDNGHRLTVSQVGGDSANVGSTVNGNYGSVKINADGSYTYNLDNANASVQALREGQTVIDTFNVQITDEYGATAAETLTITITGTNDAPAISLTGTDHDSAALTETSAPLTDSGTLTLTDIDVKDSVYTVKVDSIVKGGSYTGTLPTDGALKDMLSISDGALSNSETGGKINWNFDSGSEHFDFLAEGETLTLIYQVKSTDDSGTANDSDTHEITITITGTNDAPVVTAVAGAATEDTALTASGNVITEHTTDLDASDTHTISTVNGEPDKVGQTINGTYGDIKVNADGSYEYTLRNDDANVQALAAGESHDEVFSVTVSDGHGGETTQDITVTVHGTNDAPTAQDNASSVVEDTRISTGDTDTAHADGSILANDADVDNGHRLTVSQVGGDSANVGSTVNGNYGSVKINADGSYTYNLDNANASVQALREGQTVIDTFNVQITDEHGATATETLTITITGTNDAPVISLTGTDSDSKSFNEANSALTESGSLTLTDIDLNDTVGTVKADTITTGGTYAGTLPSDDILKQMLTLTNGSLDDSQAAGKINWTFDSGAENFDFLEAGETLTLTYTVKSTDDSGTANDSDTHEITITITGTNDAPVVTAVTGAATEDTALTASGNVITDHTTDLDASDTHTISAVNGEPDKVGQTINGTYGDIKVNADGSYEYTLRNDDANVQALAAGESHDEVFSVTVSDGHGGETTQDITVTVHGTNDAPTAQDNASSVVEDTRISTGDTDTAHADGNILANDSDIDNNHTLTVSQVGGDSANVGSTVNGNYGSVKINADGSYTYNLDNANASVQALREGQTVTDTFNVQITDEYGATAAETLTITITGTNDAPTAENNIGSVVEDDRISTTESHTTSDGNILDNDSDIDNNHTLTISQVGGDSANVGSTVNGNYGSVKINADGSYTYNLDNANASVQALREGQTVTDTFNVQITDEYGATAAETLTITITGTNDAPAISLTGTDHDSAALTETSAPLTDSGTLTLTDIDVKDSVYTVKVDSIVKGGSYTGTLPTDGALKDMLSISNGALSNSETGGKINWNFDSGSEHFDFLAAGETLTLTYTVKSTDDSGTANDSDTHEITITITGTNDAPVVTAVTGDVTEDADATPSTSDSLTASGNIITDHTTDLDASDTHTISAVNGEPDKVGQTINGTYGDIKVNADGSYEYTLRNDDANVQALAAGESHDEIFSVTVSDGHGGETTQDITVTVHGTNDAPTAENNIGSVVEDTRISTGDTDTAHADGSILANDADVDNGHRLTVSQVGGDSANVGSTVNGNYGSVKINADGSYTYNLDNANASVQALREGQTVTDTFNVQITDEYGATATETLTITITGTNDAPVISLTGTDSDSKSFNEANSALTESGSLTLTDIDLNDTVGTVKADTITTGGTYAGTLPSDDILKQMLTLTNSSLDDSQAAGKINWTFDSGAENFDFLAEGETLTLTYQVKSTDNSGTANDSDTHEITITITGTNDAPVVTAVTGDVTEDADATTSTSDSLTASGNIITDHTTDLDASDTHTISAVNGEPDKVGQTINGIYGDIKVNADGSYEYTLRNDDANVQALAAGESRDEVFSVTVSDGHGGETTQDITVTVHGTNDAPTAENNIGSVVEDDRISTTESHTTSDGNILANDSDIDNNHTLTVSQVGGDSANVGTAVNGVYGKVTINADGSYTYELNNNADSVQALREGQTVTDTFNVQITDEYGATAAETLTITITGTNDTPAISLTGTDHDSAALTETSAPLTDSGTLTLTDIDVKDSVYTVKVDSIVKGGSYTGTLPTDGALKDMLSISNGALSNSETGGKINWNFDSGSEHFDFLAAGETLTLTYTVKSTDDSHTENDSDTHEITITITGTNDAPKISGTFQGAVTETDSMRLTDSGTLTITDADISNTVTVSVDKVEGYTASPGAGVPTLEEVKNMLTIAKAGETAYGPRAEVVASGETGAADNLLWKFDTGSATFDYLKKDETVTLKYTLTAEDSSGAKTTQVVTVTVTGTNDTPELTVDTATGDSASAPGLTESAAALTATGKISVSDGDIKDTISENIIDSVNKAGSTAGLTLSDAQLKALLTLNTTGLTNGNDSGKLEWKFDNTGNTHAFDYLKEGDTLTITYNVKVKDSSGQGTASGANEADTSNIVPITITITGTNSAPVLAVDTNSVTEDNGLLDGAIQTVETAFASVITDADTDADYNGKDGWQITSAKETSADEGTAVAAGETAADITGKYGTLHIKADGSYTYTLNNNSDQIQQLGHDGKLADTFTVTVTDGNLTATQTLTINIGGANDRPTISVASDDSAAADVTEGNIVPSNKVPEATGTLTFSDIDLGDHTTVTKLANDTTNFTISGKMDGLISTRDELYNMLTLDDTTFTTDSGTNSHQLTWTFESGDERFNYLKEGEKLTLTYKVQAKDDSGINANNTSNTQDIVITIKGSDSATDSNPSPDTGTVAEDKTLTVSGHHGTSSGANQNLLYNDDSDGYITKFAVNGRDCDTGAKTAIYAADGTTKLGDITIQANGNYTFTPVKNYSGPVPQITYTTSNGNTSTLNIAVTPVADKPTWVAQDSSVTEDTGIAMNLKLPTITDDRDLDGESTTGDHPERLGYITLENIGKATVYNGDTALTATGGKITIAIVDSSSNLDTSLHYTGLDINGTDVVKLTREQFEALSIQQEAQSGKNITGLKLSVTSYETDNTGVPHTGLAGATDTKTFAVDVLAVTDATPTITLDGLTAAPTETQLQTAIGNNHITITDHQGTAEGTISAKTEGGSSMIVIEEDCTMKIDAEYLKASVTSADTDGSERYVVTVSGLAAGSVVNGVTAGADGTVTLKAETSVTSDNINIFTDGLTITPPENFRGKMGEVTIKVETYDTDGDSSGEIAHQTAEMTLPVLVVTPVPDGVDTIAVKQAIGNEDEAIALHIKPSSADPSETFNVTIKGIPYGSKIVYDDHEVSVSDGSVTIDNFDNTKSLTITPPPDSNEDFELNVSAVSVESDSKASDPSDDVPLQVTVHSVADTVSINTNETALKYTEKQAEADEISLAKLIVKNDDANDGSEQVTLTVTGLAPEFTLDGSAVEFKGGEGANRVWLITMDQGNIANTNAYIKTPKNFSGEITFSAQATNTDSTSTGTTDSNSRASDVTNVTITVTPTPEATVNQSATAAEDTLERLSFAIQRQNGDMDETLDAIYIKAADVDDAHGKNFNIFYSEDGGENMMTLKDAVDAGKITLEDGYYRVTANAGGTDVETIFVKGTANHSGTGDTLTIKYAVTDKEYTGEGTHTESDPPVTFASEDVDYNITFTPVTDATTMSALKNGDINVNGKDDITLAGTTVTINSGSDNTFSVKATVNAPQDTDDSEHFVKLIVDGVPDGISVKDATYLGDSGAATGTGRWLLTVDSGNVFDSTNKSYNTEIQFTVDRGNPNIWALNGQSASKVTITAVSQDILEEMKGDEALSSESAEFAIAIKFSGTGPALQDIPAPNIIITPGEGTTEDSSECNLGNFIKADYQINGSVSQTEYRFSFEIKGFPEGTVITGDAVKDGKVTIAGDGTVQISGFGNQDAMQSVLNNIKVTLPENYNNNSDGNTEDGMNLKVTWKTDGWNLNGDDAPAPATDTINVTPNVTPITNPMEITIMPASGMIDENQPGEANTLTFSVNINAGGDGAYGVIKNSGKLYLKLDGAQDGDTVTCDGKTYSLTEVGAETDRDIPDGKYYVIEGVAAGNSLEFSYQPRAFYSGDIKVTALLASQETGAENIEKAEGSTSLTINPVNTEYKFTAEDVTASENDTAELKFTSMGDFDTDGSEIVHTVVLSGFDAAHGDDFIVKYTADGEEKTAAKVAATDANSNITYEWVLSTGSNGKLPADVKITGLNHYSGTQHLTMTVVTGETALSAGRENSVDFDVTFTPTADGFSDFTPTLAFGKAGEYIDLNLNAMANDTSGNSATETATVELNGLGDGASFFIGRDSDGNGTEDTFEAVTVSYAEGKYTLTGIALEDINNIKIVSPNVGKHTVDVDAWTVEPAGSEGEKESAHTAPSDGTGSNSFVINIAAAAPTANADRLIYAGDGAYDGGDGTDTLYMANFREAANSGMNDIDFSSASGIKNIEIIDMSDGNHALTNITADAVKGMTGADNQLTIRGEAGDKIALSAGWTKGDTVDSNNYWTYTNNGATLLISDGVEVTQAALGLSMLAMASFAPLAAAEPIIMPDAADSFDYGDYGSQLLETPASNTLSFDAGALVDFSSLADAGQTFGMLNLSSAPAQEIYNVTPYSVYSVTGGEHTLEVTGGAEDAFNTAHSQEFSWNTPALSADGSHYVYTATGDFDRDAATPDETVTLNVAREIYDDTLAYDAGSMNDGGLGDDTLTFGHADLTIDFSGGAASRIANIERFDLGDGNHALENLTAKDVFEMTDARNTLTINGDDADNVRLSDVLNDAADGMWEASPIHGTENGVGYSLYIGAYEGQTVTLKIEDEIIQQLTTHTKG